MVLLEMMGSGIPAIASPVGGISDIIQDGEKWITVDGLFGGDNCEEHRKCNCGFRRKLSAYGGKRI